MNARPAHVAADIIWDWSFDTESGRFTTTGTIDPATGSPPAGFYELLDFSYMSSSVRSELIGSVSGGEWIVWNPNPGVHTPYLQWGGSPQRVIRWLTTPFGADEYWRFDDPTGTMVLTVGLYDPPITLITFYNPNYATLDPGLHWIDIKAAVLNVGPVSSAVPEPSSLILLISGLITGAGLRKRFNRYRK